MKALKTLLAPLSTVLLLSLRQDSAVVPACASEDKDVALAVPSDPADTSDHPQPDEIRDVFGEPWGRMGGLRGFNVHGLNFDDMTARINSLFSDFFGDRSPFSGMAFMKPKVEVHEESKCRYTLTWEHGTRAENIRVLLSLRNRRIGVVYRSATDHHEKTKHGVSHSMSKEESKQFLSVDPACMMTPKLVAERLVGWTDNLATAAEGAPHKLLITFPSVSHLKRMVEEGHLPEDVETMLQDGDVSGLSPFQRCLVSGRGPEECAYAKEQQVQLQETPLPVDVDQEEIDLPRF